MKKIITLAVVLTGLNSYAQQWAGSTATTGTIHRTGNVGIGTSTPSQLLDVNGNISVSGTHFVYNSQYAVIDWGGLGVGDLYFRTLNTQGNIGGYNDRMCITNNGSVGIGTNTPSAQFHIKNTGATPWFVERSNNPISNQDNGLKLFFGSTAATGLGGGTAVFQMTNPNNISDMAFMTNTTSVPFIIKAGGRVGIGTTSPTTTLTVNGNMLIGNPSMVNLPLGYKLYVETGILTEKIKVAIVNSANWADYVFGQAYNLRPLSEVEAYVKTNKHLPGIPSAQEIVDNGGVDLGEMNVKLLEKVEELTLYLIEQNKKIEELQKEVKALK